MTPTKRQYQVLAALEEHGISRERDVCSPSTAKILADLQLISRSTDKPRMISNTPAGTVLANAYTASLRERLDRQARRDREDEERGARARERMDREHMSDAQLRDRLANAEADRDDYERRWIEECRAHGDTRRKLEEMRTVRHQEAGLREPDDSYTGESDTCGECGLPWDGCDGH